MPFDSKQVIVALKAKCRNLEQRNNVLSSLLKLVEVNNRRKDPNPFMQKLTSLQSKCDRLKQAILLQRKLATDKLQKLTQMLGLLAHENKALKDENAILRARLQSRFKGMPFVLVSPGQTPKTTQPGGAAKSL